MENKHERPVRSITDQVNPIKFSFVVEGIQTSAGRVIDISNYGACGLASSDSNLTVKESGTLIFNRGGGSLLKLDAEVRWIDGNFVGFQTKVNMKTTVMRNYLG